MSIVDLIIDLALGDSAKGKSVAYLVKHGLCSNLRFVSRFNGGPNAGHTVVQDGKKVVLHMIPSSIVYGNEFNVDSVIAPNCVLNPNLLLDTEMKTAIEAGIDFSRFKIAKETFLIMPWHLAIEAAEEAALGGTKRDTTLRGIGSACRDIIGKYAIRVGDLLNESLLRELIKENLAVKNLIDAIRAENYDLEALVAAFLKYGSRLEQYMIELDPYMAELLNDGDSFLIEGAQGNYLDWGSPCYPYTSSSGLTRHDAEKVFRLTQDDWRHIYGIVKAYTTSVGYRIFPTKLENAIGKLLRELGGEFGATSGRPRDCGWLDLVMIRTAAHWNSVSELIVTKLDVLDTFDEIKVCVGYRRNGIVEEFTPRMSLAGCEPVYETLPGWLQPTTEARKPEDLPINARKYLDFICDNVGCPVIGASVGPETDQMVWFG